VTIRHSYGPSIDVWACGCILYQLLGGSTPFAPAWDNARRRWDFEPMNKRILDRDYDILLATAPWTSVSNSARGLLTIMLDADASRRPTAAACLEHPWFTATKSASRSFSSAASWRHPADQAEGSADWTVALPGVPSKLAGLRESHHASLFPPEASHEAQANAKKLLAGVHSRDPRWATDSIGDGGHTLTSMDAKVIAAALE